MNYSTHGKRLFDIAFSLMAILFLLPVFLLTAIFIVLDDGRPVLFKQGRVGKDRSIFEIYKFRSMKTGVGDIPSAKAPTHVVTTMGRILRRTNIDELPQLINVLKGDMSIVGPRPPLPSQLDLLRVRSEHGGENLRPGLTGLAQINGYDGMTEADKGMFDAEYSRKITFLQDILIILKTFGYLLRKPPVY